MKKVATIDGIRRLLRVGRDGKNRYCIYYFYFTHRRYGPAIFRKVVVGGLTKLAAYGTMKLLEE